MFCDLYNSSKVRLSYSYTVAVLFSLNLSLPRSRTVCVLVMLVACSKAVIADTVHGATFWYKFCTRR